MTVITFTTSGTVGLDMTTLDFKSYISGELLVQHSDSVLLWTNGSTRISTITGSGIVSQVIFGTLTDISAGTFTSFTSSDGISTFSMVGLNVSGVTFFDLALAQQWDKLAALTESGNDIVSGTANNDVLVGGAGTDALAGGGGADKLIGGAGADTLLGGAGSDRLIGGAGSDTFVFDTRPGTAGVDTIRDFQHHADHIVLQASDFANVGAVGVLGASHFIVGSAATTGAQGIRYDAATGNLFSDADGSGPTHAILFAHLDPGLNLTASDFLIA